MWIDCKFHKVREAKLNCSHSIQMLWLSAVLYCAHFYSALSRTALSLLSALLDSVQIDSMLSRTVLSFDSMLYRTAFALTRRCPGQCTTWLCQSLLFCYKFCYVVEPIYCWLASLMLMISWSFSLVKLHPKTGREKTKCRHFHWLSWVCKDPQNTLQNVIFPTTRASERLLIV